MKRNNTQRTPQELYEFLRKINIRLCFTACIFILIMLGFVLLSFFGLKDIGLFWQSVIKVVLIIIVLIAAVIFIVCGVKLRRLKKEIDDMEYTEEQETERENG